MNECSGCGVDFAGMAAFDSHRVGPFAQNRERSARRCLSVAEMESARRKDGSRVFDLLPDGKVSIWRTEEQKESLRRLGREE